MTAASAGRVVTRLMARQVWRGALVVAVVAAGMSALVADQYQSMFGGALGQTALRALADNPAIRILFGPPVALDDAGGFTVWRTGTPVQVLVAVWALLAATRITRGEEDTGRAELLLAGRLRTRDLVVRGLAVLTAAAVVIGAAVAVALLAAGTDPVGAFLHASGIAGVSVTFAALGVLAAQIMPSRAAATGVTVAALGAALLLRMLADGVHDLAWLAWTSPFAVTARVAPYADNRPGPLLVLAALPVLLAGAAVAVTFRRDVGAGLLRPSGPRRARTRLLRSIPGFAIRRAIRPSAGWAIGLGAYFLLVGALTGSVLQFLRDNARFADLASAAGFTGLATTEGFAAAMFSLLAIPTGLYAATRIATMATDETDRRWTPLFALPLSRRHIALTEIAVTAVGVLALLTLAGFAVWTGATLAAVPLTVTAALTGAWNVAPVALLGLGAATLALGWTPRAVAAVGALPIAGGFLLQVTTQTTGPAWLTDLSPFAHLAAVPDAAPDWIATIVLTAIAALLAALGVVGYCRRDLTT